jgi:hypothetical protein
MSGIAQKLTKIAQILFDTLGTVMAERGFPDEYPHSHNRRYLHTLPQSRIPGECQNRRARGEPFTRIVTLSGSSMARLSQMLFPECLQTMELILR